MYWRPSTEYVIGEPLCGAGIHTAPTCAPVFLSYARSIAPRGCSGVVVTDGSPRTTSVLVTTRPTLPGCPVLGIVFPASSGLLRTASGVSPCGTCHFIVPLSRSMAFSRPYGGLRSGSPCTTRPPPPPCGAAGGAPAPGAAGAAAG